MIIVGMGSMGLLLCGLVTASCALLSSNAAAMTIRVVGDELILSGPVTGNELQQVQNALATSPFVSTVILRNSPGGDAPSGYAVGDLFRARKMRTAVSGFCYSSCSRMFLGGVVRQFTSDYPQEFTEVGFHGHYQADGRLDAAYVARLGLAAWILEHSDGKADPTLVERWVNIPFSSGLIHFYHPGLQQTRGHTTFMCQGDEGLPLFRCEAVARTALDVGVITSLDLLASNDQSDLRASVPARIEPSGWASEEDLVRVPLATDAGRAEYQRFLAAPDPKAFAVSSTGVFWAWNSGPSNALARALERCAARASGQPCVLYAIDNTVVWAPTPARVPRRDPAVFAPDASSR